MSVRDSATACRWPVGQVFNLSAVQLAPVIPREPRSLSKSTDDLNIVADVQRSGAAGDRPRVDGQAVKVIEPRAGGPIRERLVPLPLEDRRELVKALSRLRRPRRNHTALTGVGPLEQHLADLEPHRLSLFGIEPVFPERLDPADFEVG